MGRNPSPVVRREVENFDKDADSRKLAIRMGRNLSPVVRRELENLDKDADSRKLAIKALKSYVKELDSKAIPLFLAKVSETKETGSLTGEHTISLYEVMARVHGQKIIPLIDNIMDTVIKTLMSSAGSFALHQACSKVVPAIARYGMDPTTPEDKKKYIIHSLCKPLSDCLLGSDEYLSSGSALCLKALVECDNWKFASNEMVNEVCQRVTAALDKHVQTNNHMGLVMSLAKHNGLILEAYARLLISSGLQTMNKDVNSHKRLSAIHMVNCLMKCLDHESIFSELGRIIKAMESCHSDHMAYVCGAADEALQTARKISIEKSSKFDRDMSSLTHSNGDKRGEIRRRNLSSTGEHSPLPASPESQTVDSFFHDSLFDSPHSSNQVSPEFSCNRRSVNRKLWSRYQNGGVDISLEDGFFSDFVRGGDDKENVEHNVNSENCGGYSDEFMGFSQANGRNDFNRSTTTSPQRSRSQINVDSVKIYATPRKLFRSLQDPNDENSSISDRQNGKYGSPGSQFELTPTSKPNVYYVNYKLNTNEKQPCSAEEQAGSSESVSSTQDILTETALHGPQMISEESKGQCNITSGHNRYKKFFYSLFIVLAVLVLAVFVCFWTDEDEGHFLVPT